MITQIIQLPSNIRGAWQRHGFLGLMGCMLDVFSDLISRFIFQYVSYYLYEDIFTDLKEADFLPRLEQFSLKIVSTIQEAEEMAACGSDIFHNSFNSRQRLDAGAVGFCVFIDNELIHVGWVAMTESAKNSFEPQPYKVDFSKLGCIGGTVTKQAYRGKGLHKYTYFKRCQYLIDHGKIGARYVIDTKIIPAQRVVAKFGAKIYAKGYYVRIFRWHIWKQLAFSQTIG